MQACAEHFVANNREHWRYGVTSNLDEKRMREVYGWPFMRNIDVCFQSLLLLLSISRVPGIRCWWNPVLQADVTSHHVCIQPRQRDIFMRKFE